MHDLLKSIKTRQSLLRFVLIISSEEDFIPSELI